MINIHTEQSLHIVMEVKKGNSTELVNFGNTDWKLLLLDCDAKTVKVLDAVIGTTGAVESTLLAYSMPEGVYGVKLIWRANGGNRTYCVEKKAAWSVDNSEISPSSTTTVSISIPAYSDTYGYDGLSAYELAVLKGLTNKGEDKWVSSMASCDALIGDFHATIPAEYGSTISQVLAYLIENGGGGSTTKTVTYDLSHVTVSPSTASVEKGESYSAVATVASGYTLTEVEIKMGGLDITASSYNPTTGAINVSTVTANLRITLKAREESIYSQVHWLDTAYSIGDNLKEGYGYNAWAPGCANYDEVKQRIMFLQCHRYAHGNTAYTSSEIWSINPYNLFDKTLVATFPTERIDNKIVPLAFTIYDGVYYVVSLYNTHISRNRGETWEKIAHNTLDNCFGVKIIDGVMYVGDDGRYSTYGKHRFYRSTDYGRTFEEVELDFGDYNDTVEWSEVNFVKFKNDIYMGVRRENQNGLLCKLNSDDTVTVITDQLPNVGSDCYMYATDDVIAFGAVDRPAVHMKLGTVSITSAGAVINVVKDFDFSSVSRSGDFHTPTYIYNENWQIAIFMCGLTEYEYTYGCNNVAVVGYKNLTQNENITYHVVPKNAPKSYITAEPYVGTPYSEGYTVDSVYNLSERCAQAFPLDGNNVVIQVPNMHLPFLCSNGRWIAYNASMWDAQLHSDGKYYAMLVKTYTSNLAGQTSVPMKMIAPAKKIVVGTIDPANIVPEGGQFTYAKWAVNAAETRETMSYTGVLDAPVKFLNGNTIV